MTGNGELTVPGFTAEVTAYRSPNANIGRASTAPGGGAEIVPAIPACKNCDWICNECARTGRFLVCKLCYGFCASGFCYEERSGLGLTP